MNVPIKVTSQGFLSCQKMYGQKPLYIMFMKNSSVIYTKKNISKYYCNFYSLQQ